MCYEEKLAILFLSILIQKAHRFLDTSGFSETRAGLEYSERIGTAVINDLTIYATLPSNIDWPYQ
jgi:hypothetical protein